MRNIFNEIVAIVKNNRNVVNKNNDNNNVVKQDSMLPCPEHKLIPYETAPLPPGPWLVFAPHADDETFGLGGCLLKASDENVETHVVVVTDGAQGGDEPGKHGGLADRRREEVERAGNLLGLRGLECWSEPDRGLKVDSERTGLFADAIRKLQPAAVFFPGPLEIHPDHRATGMLAWAALQSLEAGEPKPQALSYEITALNPINLLIDITAQMERKHEVMAVYVSQNSQNSYPDYVTALNRSRSFSLPSGVIYAEGLYRYDEDQLRQPLAAVVQKIIAGYFAPA
ncbi:MAG: PIG-L family deacetylase [Gammaproteobacteria bacterium]|nr:PIG-L family deacetylase [Gammaproteobacteria bacterium]MYH86601.1 PIG-L family deacetylase [Gammaproteobacteria bacterium]MYK04074.1 PIG-L family deacetylase [Gammaproteobacteria bacterium]